MNTVTRCLLAVTLIPLAIAVAIPLAIIAAPIIAVVAAFRA